MMMTMKKRSFIFILIIAALVGAMLTGGAVFYAGTLSGGFIPITKDDYEQYKFMKAKFGKINELWAYIDENYYVKPDDKKLEEGMYKGLFWGLGDPYSGYLTAAEYEQTKIAVTGEYDGIGLTMAADNEGYISVVAPTDDAPAYKAGIKNQDRIVKIDGKSYDAATMDQAAAALRGKAGTKVHVTILRGSDTLEMDLIRANIVNHTVKDEMLDGDIAYIRIIGFEENTAKDFETALKKYEDAGAKGLVIDLRDNGGGLVNIGVEIADRLLPEGIVTYTEDRKGQRVDFKSEAGRTKLPYVVLVNEGTASTSEIVAAAIKDAQGGTLVGTTTFGKGIIQSVNPLKTGDALKLTIMQYFSPKGEVIHKKGVEPDVKVVEAEDETQDLQLDKASELLKAK